MDRAQSSVYPVRQGTLCVLEDGGVIAAAQWLRFSPEDPFLGAPFRDEMARAWLVAEADQRAALQFLLTRVEAIARDLACTAIRVDARYSFGSGWLGLARPWSHLTEGVQAAGYVVTEPWIILTRETAPSGTGPTPEPTGTNTIWRTSEAAGEWTCIVREGEAELGECRTWSLPSHLQSCPGAEEWITIEWIDVDEAHQRRGLGSYLMVEQLAYQARRGRSRVILWCDPTDRGARKFYRVLRFREAFRTASFYKGLGLRASSNSV